jgi:Acyl-CoA dehydrogenase, C-terminal domain
MSDTDNDLDQFVAMLPRLLTEHISPGTSMDSPQQLEALRRALDESDITNLALESLELPNSLTWLTTTVSEVAQSSPSLAFVLASRYVAQRALAAVDGESAAEDVGAAVICPATSDGVSFPDTAIVADLFQPERLVLADTASCRTLVLHRSDVSHSEDARTATTGLVEARLSEFHVDGPAGVTLDDVSTAVIVRDWNILMSAVSLGIAAQARRVSEAYAADRHQFGSPLTGFTALRSILAEMQLQIAGIRALLDRAVTDEVTLEASAELWATAGPAAVDIALNAIQLHGGYGYIDEYPVAGLLRDAVSVRARGCDRRSAIAATAAARLGALT